MVQHMQWGESALVLVCLLFLFDFSQLVRCILSGPMPAGQYGTKDLEHTYNRAFSAAAIV
jgi:hypothetical protein